MKLRAKLRLSLDGPQNVDCTYCCSMYNSLVGVSCIRASSLRNRRIARGSGCVCEASVRAASLHLRIRALEQSLGDNRNRIHNPCGQLERGQLFRFPSRSNRRRMAQFGEHVPLRLVKSCPGRKTHPRCPREMTMA